MSMTQRQQKFLLDRLEGVRISKPHGWESLKYPDTAAVRRARRQVSTASRVIKAHERKTEKRRNKRNEAIRSTVAQIKQTILFGDARKAIALLDSFEKTSY